MKTSAVAGCSGEGAGSNARGAAIDGQFGGDSHCLSLGCMSKETGIVPGGQYLASQWRVCNARRWQLGASTSGTPVRSDVNAITRTVFHRADTNMAGPCRDPDRNGRIGAQISTLKENRIPCRKGEDRKVALVAFQIKESDDMEAMAKPKIWYEFEKILSFRKLTGTRIKRCNSGGCSVPACSVWYMWEISDCQDAPTKKNGLYLCVDCQETKFGGWPPLHELLGKGYMSEEKRAIIATKCSNQLNPSMPPAFVKDLAK